MAVGGNWPGSPDLTTTFPATMMVDYVRVYQEINNLSEETISSIALFPNPVTDVLSIDADTGVEAYTITNLQGEELLFGNSSTIDLNELIPGMYLINVELSDGTLSTASFVKD